MDAPRVFVELEISGQDLLEERLVGVGLVRVGVERRVACQQGNQGSMLRSQFSAMFANFRPK
jgi:hypothetical protein